MTSELRFNARNADKTDVRFTVQSSALFKVPEPIVLWVMERSSNKRLRVSMNRSEAEQLGNMLLSHVEKTATLEKPKNEITR